MARIQPVVNDRKQWGRLERYVKDILTEFRNDKRILLWDLYNEPGNSGQGSKSVPLVKKVFEWAREVDSIHPLSIWLQGSLPVQTAHGQEVRKLN